jgi:hypothetical protein
VASQGGNCRESGSPIARERRRRTTAKTFVFPPYSEILFHWKVKFYLQPLSLLFLWKSVPGEFERHMV